MELLSQDGRSVLTACLFRENAGLMDGAVMCLLPGFPLKQLMGRALQKGLVPLPPSGLIWDHIKGTEDFR